MTYMKVFGSIFELFVIKIKIDLEELSFGSDATAEEIVLNSPVVVVPARTTIDPDGGEVREAASTPVPRVKP